MNQKTTKRGFQLNPYSSRLRGRGRDFWCNDYSITGHSDGERGRLIPAALCYLSHSLQGIATSGFLSPRLGSSAPQASRVHSHVGVFTLPHEINHQTGEVLSSSTAPPRRRASSLAPIPHTQLLSRFLTSSRCRSIRLSLSHEEVAAPRVLWSDRRSTDSAPLPPLPPRLCIPLLRAEPSLASVGLQRRLVFAPAVPPVWMRYGLPVTLANAVNAAEEPRLKRRDPIHNGPGAPHRTTRVQSVSTETISERN